MYLKRKRKCMRERVIIELWRITLRKWCHACCWVSALYFFEPIMRVSTSWTFNRWSCYQNDSWKKNFWRRNRKTSAFLFSTRGCKENYDFGFHARKKIVRIVEKNFSKSLSVIFPDKILFKYFENIHVHEKFLINKYFFNST